MTVKHSSVCTEKHIQDYDLICIFMVMWLETVKVSNCCCAKLGIARLWNITQRLHYDLLDSFKNSDATNVTCASATTLIKTCWFPTADRLLTVFTADITEKKDHSQTFHIISSSKHFPTENPSVIVCWENEASWCRALRTTCSHTAAKNRKTWRNKKKVTFHR